MRRTLAPEPTRSPLPERALAALLALVSTGFVVDHVVRTDFRYHLWSDRDMLRSDVPFADLPNMGAELWYGIGARIPGGAMHTLWWAVLCLRDDPRAVWHAQWALLVAAAALLGRAVSRRLGALAGAMVFATWVGSPVVWASLRTLWNPGWTPIFLAVALIAWMRAVLDRNGRGVIAFALAVALGATAHLSVGVLALSVGVVAVVARPAVSAGRIGLAALAVLGAYTPYLVSDAASGWSNTRALFVPQQLEVVLPTSQPGGAPGEVLGILAQLVGLDLWGPASGHAGLAAGLGLVAAALGMVAHARRGHADGRLLAASCGALALFTGAYTVARLDAGSSTNVRYLLVATPLVALVAGAGAGALRALPRAARAMASVLVVLVPAGLLGVQRSNAETERREPEIYDYGHLTQVLDAVRESTGWTLSELAGRTLAVRVRGGAVERHRNVPIAWPLARAGQAFPGSLPPPCAMHVTHDPGTTSWATPLSLAEALVVDEVAAVERVVPLDERHGLVLYTPRSGRCPTSFDQRYVLTPEEQLTWAAWTGHADLPVRRLPDEAGLARWLVSWDAGGADTPTVVLGLLTLAVRDGVAEVALHANQLRGEGWNYGFFGNASVRGVRLVARDAAGLPVGAVDLATGVVGGLGALTPLRVRGPWPPGATPELVIGVDPALLPWRGAPPPSEPRLVVIPLR